MKFQGQRTNRPTGVMFTRRRLLQVSAGGAMAVPLLGACGRDDPGADSSSNSGSSVGGSLRVAIPTATSADEDFYTDALEQFGSNHGVEVQPLFFPDPQFAEAIQGLFRSGDAPDVYRMVKAPVEMPAAWANGWLQPLDNFAVIIDLLEDEYGESALDPARSGLHIAGELYGVPGVRNDVWSTLRPLMYNPEIFDRYGIDDPPVSYTDLRDVAAKITTDSGGDVSGMALGSGVAGITLLPAYQAAGPVRTIGGVPVDLQTGRAAASSDSVVHAVELLRGMVEDGSVINGWQNLDAQQFWQAWATQKVAIAAIAPWWAEEIAKVDPDVPMAFAPFPTPGDGRKGYQTRDREWAPTWGLTAESRNPEAAASLIAHLGSVEVQRNYYGVSLVPTALADNYADDLRDVAATILGLEDSVMRLGPSVTTRSKDGQALITDIQTKAPQPPFAEIVFSAVDQGADYARAAGEFDVKAQAVLDETIAAAVSDGAAFDKNILVFEDWDPAQDYVTEPLS